MSNLGIFSEIYHWLESFINVNPWISAVLIGFFSSFGVFFSFAPSVVLYVVLFAQGYNPLLIAVCAGFGAMTGELSSYYLGYIGKKNNRPCFKQNFQRYTIIPENERIFHMAR